MQRTPYGGGPERHSRTRATRCRNEAARSRQTVDEFLGTNDLGDVEPLGVPKVYLVNTEAGLEAIELANDLARLPGVTSCSPNLWTEEVEQ